MKTTKNMLRIHLRSIRLCSGLAVLLLLGPLSANAKPTVQDFMSRPTVRDMELSPDGTHLAMVIETAGQRYVTVRDITKPDMPLVGNLSNEFIRPNFLYWGNDDRLLVALSVPYNMNRVMKDKARDAGFDINDYPTVSRMVALNKDMSDMVVLLEDERALRRNISLSRVTNFIPTDNDHVLIDAYRKERRTQFRVNINTGDATRVAVGGRRTYRFVNDDDGAPRYRFDYLRRSKAIVIYEFESEDKWKKVEKIYLIRDYLYAIDTTGLVALNGDNLVYRKINDETGYYELIMVDSDTGERESLVSLPDQDVRGVLFSSRTDGIVGYTTEEDYIRHHYFDADLQEIYDGMSKQMGSYNFSLKGYADDYGTALARSWGMDDPLSYHLWHQKKGELQFLAHAYMKLAESDLATQAFATYKARDGLSIRSYLLLPDNYVKGEPHPTIVLPHGGPHARSRVEFSTLAQFLATRGYVVIEPNFRGSSGYGRDFEEAGYQQWGGTMQDDLTDAVEFLVREGVADPERICIVGGSYGGYAALMGAIKTPELFQCAISMNGVTHLPDMLKYDMKELVDKEDWQEVLFDRVGHPDTDRDRLEANSPALHADRIQIPIMLIAGTEDQIVPYAQARRMRKALKKADVEFEFIRLENTGHNPLYYRKDVETVLPAIEQFLARALSVN